MKKIRLIILSYTILCCITLTGCSWMLIPFNFGTQSLEIETQTEIDSETKIEIETEIENQVRRQEIKASIVTKYSEKEIFVYSDATCFFDLTVSIQDGKSQSIEKFGEFQINKGETIRLTIEDLISGFFSDEAVITDIPLVGKPYIYVESDLSEVNYEEIRRAIIVKASQDEVIVYSHEDCFFDITLFTQDANFKSKNEFRRIKINKGETITLTLDDLAPGFFSEDTKITSYSSGLLSSDCYIEK